MIKSEEMLPQVYAQSWDIRTLCRIFDLSFDQVKYYTDRILDCYSPENCPDNLLPELAEHIGFKYQDLKSVMYNRVVLKNFVRYLIRYRGSLTGISNAAAIDLRYRERYPDQRFDTRTASWVDDEKARELIPMNYYESIPTEKTWIDSDNMNGIIYLFILSNSFFESIPEDATEEERQRYLDDQMRRLLDLSYLQEYVRPVGMYLLPMVARKIDAKTDLTVKAVRIPEEEKGWRNGVKGTPKVSEQHRYDRLHFASLENQNHDLNSEPWLKTLYHSQLAGNLNHQYFTSPVYDIRGKLLYYDHSELQKIYSAYASNVPGMKIGDSLYNPNAIPPAEYPQDYSYGRNPENEPSPENYNPYLTPDGEDNGTNRNLMVNLFQVDIETGEGLPQGVQDIQINGKDPAVPKSPVPYNPAGNDDLSGDNIFYTMTDDGSEDELIP